MLEEPNLENGTSTILLLTIVNVLRMLRNEELLDELAHALKIGCVMTWRHCREHVSPRCFPFVLPKKIPGLPCSQILVSTFINIFHVGSKYATLNVSRVASIESYRSVCCGYPVGEKETLAQGFDCKFFFKKNVEMSIMGFSLDRNVRTWSSLSICRLYNVYIRKEQDKGQLQQQPRSREWRGGHVKR